MMHYEVIEGKRYGFPTYAIKRKCMKATTVFNGRYEFRDSIVEYVWRPYLTKE